ncbi:GNAT family N-acetyltransferase [Niastella caeni]|uniref:GNAT family N-acetyltransferase n=1 Tax=Niastella caeni TaxID=2569763 RepID=A0A4S8I1B3_9BACT|nr:GNAT family N-acetyltransferase [Niastella caeni]THU39472.1 GNAT family N-acetyltransferase [Niastella caeni]
MVVFETDRLVIRRYTLEDEENFFRLNGDEEVMRYIRAPKDRQECALFLKRNLAFYEQFPLLGRWAMIEKSADTFVGSFAIIPVETTDHSRHAEIQLGYALLKEYWGKGYATESTLAGRQYAFDVMKLPMIVAITETENIASQKVLLRSGFIQQPNIKEGNKDLCYFTSVNPNAIETERLHLFPLTLPQLELYLKANDELEQALGLTPFGRTIAPQVRDRVTKFTLREMQQANGYDYIFHTFWLVVDKQSKMIVAELGFKGPPKEGGQVEIGYGTMPAMQGKGYMTEAVKGLLQWATAHADINVVLAETHVSNLPSIKVVQKNGFLQFDKRGEMIWWKKFL